MIYVYFFIKNVVRWSENSVRFENLMGIDFQKAKFCAIVSHCVRYGMYEADLRLRCSHMAKTDFLMT